jgi:hypothetical protein
MLPLARKIKLVVEKLDDETLVYDLQSDEAHCLNSVASLVWQHCNGRTDVAGIARKVSAKLDQPVHPDAVQLALQQLAKARLLDESSNLGSGSRRITRRELIRMAGKATAIALPMVTSIVAPDAAQAASCIPSATCSSQGGRPQFSGKCCCTPTGQHKRCSPTGPTTGACGTVPAAAGC